MQHTKSQHTNPTQSTRESSESDTARQHFLEIKDSDKLLQTCIAYKNIGKEYQRDFLRDAIRNRQYYLGNQYLRSVGERFEYRARTPGNEWRPQTTRNVIGQSIDPIHAIMASSSPLLNVKPTFPSEPVMFHPEIPNLMSVVEGKVNYDTMQSTNLRGDEVGEEFTEYLGKTRDSPYRKDQQRRSSILKESLIAGTAFTGYGIRKHPFRGTEVTVHLLQPHQILIDPECKDFVTFSDCRFMILISELDVMTIRRRYKASENEYGRVREDVTFDKSTSGGLISRVFRRLPGVTDQSHEPVTEVKEEWSLRRYPVYMLYYAGWMPDLMSIGDSHAEELDRFPYPRGRIVTWINDMKIVEDREIETWGFTFPVVGFTPNPIPHTGYGQSDVGKLVGPQDLINAFSNIIVSNAILNGHTQLLVEAGALDPRTFTVRPGAIMTLAQDALRNNRLKQLFPGPLGQEVLQYMLNLEQWTKEELGDSDGIFRGNNPSSITSGLHAATVRDSAYNFQSFRVGLLDDSFELDAFKEVSLIQQYVQLGNNYNKGYMGIKSGMDLAMRNLIYTIETESKKNLPFGSGGQFELYFAMLRNGDITHKEFFELSKFHISEEWQEKVDEAARHAIPGMPPELVVQQQMQSQQQAAEAGQLAGQIAAGEGNPAEQIPAGGGQAPPSDQTIPGVDSVQQV